MPSESALLERISPEKTGHRGKGRLDGAKLVPVLEIEPGGDCFEAEYTVFRRVQRRIELVESLGHHLPGVAVAFANVRAYAARDGVAIPHDDTVHEVDIGVADFRNYGA